MPEPRPPQGAEQSNPGVSGLAACRSEGLRNWAVFLGKLLLAAGLLFALFYWEIVRLSDVRRAAGDPVLLAGAGTLIFATVVVTVLRWRMLLASQGLALGFRELFHVYYISLACTPILPGGIGGDAVRIGYTVRLLPRRKAEAAVSVVVDRVLAMVGLVFLPCAAIVPYLPRALSGSHALLVLVVTIGGMALATVLLIGIALASRRRVGFTEWLRRRFDNRPVRIVGSMLDSLAMYRERPRIVLSAIFLSVFNQVLTVLAIAVIGWRLGFSTVSLWDLGVAAPLTQLANVLPVTPGGLGVGEVAFDQILRLLSDIGRGGAGLGSIFLAYRVLTLIVTLPGVISYLRFTAVPRDTM